MDTVEKFGYLTPRTHEQIASDNAMAEAFAAVSKRFNAAMDEAMRDEQA